MKKRECIYDSKDNDNVRKHLLSQRYALIAALVVWIIFIFFMSIPKFRPDTRLAFQILLSITFAILAWPYIQEQRGVQIYPDMIVVIGKKIPFEDITQVSYDSKTVKIEFLCRGKTKSYSLDVRALPSLPELKEIFGGKVVEEKYPKES